jgi:hypothetical protein
MLEKFINGVAAAEARISEVQLIKAYLDFHFK